MHLSTLIVVVVYCGLLMGANFRKTASFNTELPGHLGELIPEFRYGSPLTVYVFWPLGVIPNEYFSKSAIVLNILFGLGSASLIAILLEYLLKADGEGDTQR